MQSLDRSLHQQGLIQCFRAVAKDRAYFRGMGAVALGAGPAHAGYFAVYEYCRKLGTDSDHRPLIAAGESACELSVVLRVSVCGGALLNGVIHATSGSSRTALFSVRHRACCL